MTHPSDLDPKPTNNPADILAERNAARFEEIKFLEDELRKAVELLQDLDAVNARLAEVDPRLVISERAEMLTINSPDEIGRLNNYSAYLSVFGEPIYSDEDHYLGAQFGKKYIGRRPPTDEEKQKYFILGLERPDDIQGFYELAEDLGFPESRCGDLYTTNFFGDKANLRAYVLFPELFDRIFEQCLYTDRNTTNKYEKEEIYTAYTISSRLVSIDDKYVVNEKGEIDNWRLCR